MKLIELFDTSVDWHWLDPDESPFGSMLKKSALFEVGDVQYIAGFSPYPLEPGAWMFGFIANIDGEWKENEIGTGGNERLVFSTVMKIIGDFLQETSPPTLLVGALPNRRGIYQRLLQRREKDLNAIGYALGEPQETTVPMYGDVIIFPLHQEGLT